MTQLILKHVHMSIATPFVAMSFLLISSTLSLSACRSPGPAIPDAQAEMLKTLMPETIQIVKPFTTWSDFDDDGVLDGVTVYVTPLNASGDAIHAAGSIFVEMYTFRNASGEHRGRRIGLWNFPLKTDKDQKQLWRRATQMYELPISIDRTGADGAANWELTPGGKYVLVVTHNSPLGERLSDEYVIDAPLVMKKLPGGV